MGIMDFFHNQLSGVIEWKEQQPGILFYKWPSANDEIKNSSKLIVAPGQGCILVYEGKVQETLGEEGLFTLSTDNHPFITTLRRLAQQGQSEHKMKIYFYREAECVNQPWGTASPVKYMDPVYAFPVELGANGNYSFRLSRPATFFTDMIGARDFYTTDDTKQLVQGRLPQTLISHFAAAHLSYQQIDAQLDTLSQAIREKLNAEFLALGLELTDFRIEGTVFDANTQRRINEIADLSAQSQAAAQGGLTYTDLQRVQALRDAARNESGLAGAGLQLGTGLEMGKLFTGAGGGAGGGVTEDARDARAGTGKRPGEVSPQQDPAERLRTLKQLLDEGVITQQEFEDKKKEWLGKL